MFGFRGFIDESHDHDPIPRVFDLTCLIAHDSMWPWFEMAWAQVLDEKNAQLRSEGRLQISRYHAADCSNRQGEFKGWTVEEQREFSLDLFDVFRKHPVHIHGYDIPLQILVREIPETTANPVAFAYVALMTMLMVQITNETLGLYPADKIALLHDHGDYDQALAKAFSEMVADPSFKYSDRFVSITPAHWQNCVMLQAADMLAYENFKEGMRYHYPEGRNRRKSLEAILDLYAVSGRASTFGTEAIRQLNSDEKMKRRLLQTARIPG